MNTIRNREHSKLVKREKECPIDEIKVDLPEDQIVPFKNLVDKNNKQKEVTEINWNEMEKITRYRNYNDINLDECKTPLIWATSN